VIPFDKIEPHVKEHEYALSWDVLDQALRDTILTEKAVVNKGRLAADIYKFDGKLHLPNANSDVAKTVAGALIISLGTDTISFDKMTPYLVLSKVPGQITQYYYNNAIYELKKSSSGVKYHVYRFPKLISNTELKAELTNVLSHSLTSKSLLIGFLQSLEEETIYDFDASLKTSERDVVSEWFYLKKVDPEAAKIIREKFGSN
jgi:hypothetical protein